MRFIKGVYETYQLTVFDLFSYETKERILRSFKLVCKQNNKK